MQTGAYVRKQEVVAIVLPDVVSFLSHTCAEVKAAVTALGLGDANDSKDFLDPYASTTTITSNVSAKRK